MCIVAGEAVKESHVKGSVMTDLNGVPVKVDVAKSAYRLFDLPLKDIEVLARLDVMSLYMDTTGSNPLLFGGAVVQATFDLTGAVKESNSKATFFTATGAKVHIDAVAQVGTIEINNVPYPISDQAFEPVLRHKRGLIRGGFLTTSGSFTLSSGTS